MKKDKDTDPFNKISLDDLLSEQAKPMEDQDPRSKFYTPKKSKRTGNSDQEWKELPFKK